jgi:hypothetical protein
MSSSNAIDIHEVSINDIVFRLIKAHGILYVPIEPICDVLGIDVFFEQKTIRNHSMLGEHWFIRPSLGSEGKIHPIMHLPFKYFLGWLMSVNITNTDPEVEKIIIERQAKVYDTFYQFLSAHPQKLI